MVNCKTIVKRALFEISNFLDFYSRNIIFKMGVNKQSHKKTAQLKTKRFFLYYSFSKKALYPK